MKNNQGPKSGRHLKSNKCYCMLYEGYSARNIICQCTKLRWSVPSLLNFVYPMTYEFGFTKLVGSVNAVKD